MAFVIADRVSETSTTTGTGNFTLAGAQPGYQSFSAIGTGNSTYYCIAGTTEWEVGIGTYTSPNTLSRDVVLSSSNSGAKVNFSAGTKEVFVTAPASRSGLGVEGMVIHQNVIDSDVEIPAGHNGISGGPVAISDTGSVTIPDDAVWTVI